MTTEAQEARDRCYKTLEIYSRALVRIGFGVSSAEEAQTIAGAALYEVAELSKDKETQQ